MARIRTLKPEFWADEKLAPLPPMDRLVFLGLISMADDAGRLLDNVKSIDGFIFPHTDDSSRGSLDTLARMSRIIRYASASGQRIIQIVNWQRHQKVDRPSKYVLPEPSRDTRETLATDSRSDLGPTTLDRGPVVVSESGGSVVGVVIGQPAEFALQITIAANNAVTRKWGEQVHPFLHGQSIELAQHLLDAGVPLDTAKASIVEQVEKSGRNAPPKSINWFRPGIHKYHETLEQRAIQAANPSLASAGDPLDTWLKNKQAEEARSA